jgi:hypothetical protein
METERDALVPKAPRREALPQPTIVHWGSCQKILNPIMALAFPLLVLMLWRDTDDTLGKFWLCVIGFGVCLGIVLFPVRHTFAIEGDKITYVRYRFFGLNLCPLVRVFSRQVSLPASDGVWGYL